MTPEERRRAGGAVASRIKELGFTIPQFARAIGLHPSTVRRVINGSRWPQENTRRKLEAGLDWDEAEFSRRALADPCDVRALSSQAMLEELCRRARKGAL